VGQGDEVLVQSGARITTRHRKVSGGAKVVDFLRSRSVEALDGIVVSNPDAEHIGGSLDVFDAFEVFTVYLSGDPKGTSTFTT
jgi:competence protein ComEC